MTPRILREDLKQATLFVTGLFFLLPAACAEIPLYIIQGDPQPEIHLVKSEETVALIIAECVLDEFYVPEIEGIRPLKVTDWRSTLEAGFRNGFGKVRRVVASEADQTLEILRADPVIIPETELGILVHSVKARLTFHARIQDKVGGILKESWGTVAASKRVRNTSYASKNVTNAVARMYEKIAQDLFVPQNQ